MYDIRYLVDFFWADNLRNAARMNDTHAQTIQNIWYTQVMKDLV